MIKLRHCSARLIQANVVQRTLYTGTVLSVKAIYATALTVRTAARGSERVGDTLQSNVVGTPMVLRAGKALFCCARQISGRTVRSSRTHAEEVDNRGALGTFSDDTVST